jgi:hypothetical protein
MDSMAAVWEELDMKMSRDREWLKRMADAEDAAGCINIPPSWAEPLWVEVEDGFEWWWGDWTIRWWDGTGYYLKVSSGVQYGPYATLDEAKQKANEVRG